MLDGHPALQKKQLLTAIAGIFSMALIGSALSGCEAIDAEVPAAQEEHASMPSEEETTKAAEEKSATEESIKEETAKEEKKQSLRNTQQHLQQHETI